MMLVQRYLSNITCTCEHLTFSFVTFVVHLTGRRDWSICQLNPPSPSVPPFFQGQKFSFAVLDLFTSNNCCISTSGQFPYFRVKIWFSWCQALPVSFISLKNGQKNVLARSSLFVTFHSENCWRSRYAKWQNVPGTVPVVGACIQSGSMHIPVEHVYISRRAYGYFQLSMCT